MIACSGCDEWFHEECVIYSLQTGLEEKEIGLGTVTIVRSKTKSS